MENNGNISAGNAGCHSLWDACIYPVCGTIHEAVKAALNVHALSRGQGDRDVVGRYIGNEPENVHALNEIQRVAALMWFELERGHIDDFAHLLSEHWELSKKIDPRSSNTLIGQIFSAVENLIEGKMICGVGGGFLQAVMKKGVCKEMVRERLADVFQCRD